MNGDVFSAACVNRSKKYQPLASLSKKRWCVKKKAPSPSTRRNVFSAIDPKAKP
jgi:hypothetical protein